MCRFLDEPIYFCCGLPGSGRLDTGSTVLPLECWTGPIGYGAHSFMTVASFNQHSSSGKTLHARECCAGNPRLAVKIRIVNHLLDMLPKNFKMPNYTSMPINLPACSMVYSCANVKPIPTPQIQIPDLEAIKLRPDGHKSQTLH